MADTDIKLDTFRECLERLEKGINKIDAEFAAYRRDQETKLSQMSERLTKVEVRNAVLNAKMVMVSGGIATAVSVMTAVGIAFAKALIGG